MRPNPSALFYALAAIALWSTLATLGLALQHVPAFLLTGMALVTGSLPALPFVLKNPQQWRIPLSTLALGVYGLFGFHFLLFMALRHAPAVEVNLVNYLWPLFMVVLAPVLLPGLHLRARHVAAALLGFAGAAIAILGAAGDTQGGWHWGYVAAFASALIWSTYSLLTRRVRPFPTAAIGLFGLVSGVLSLACHAVLEPAALLSGQDWLLLAVMGIGPLGAAFYLWDKALKAGDARQIGVLGYLTPLGSTTLLMLATDRQLSWSIGLAAVMIIGAAVLGTRAK
ncbi:MAG: family transporter [Polaromonas sp.]|nr:family transporter [Polaromonas sp.]